MAREVRERGSAHRVSSPVGSVSKTKQAFKDDVDIHRILRKYMKTGVLPEDLARVNGVYGDFSSGADFHDYMDKVKNAEAAFMALPAAVRTYCDEDPGKLLDYLNDERHRSAFEEFGMLEAKPKDAPAEAAPGAEEPAPASEEGSS